MKKTILLIVRLTVLVVAVTVGCRAYVNMELAHHKSPVAQPVKPVN